MVEAMKKIFSTTVLCVLLLISSAGAEDLNFRVTVDRNTVELGSSLQLTLKVEGTQSFNPIKLPDLDGFESRYLGPSTHLSIVNGRTSASISFIFNLYPKRTGTLTIPAFYIKYEGQEYKTDPIQIQPASVYEQSLPDAATWASLGSSCDVSPES